MKKILIAILLTTATLQTHAQGFALVELFTSQGCSSCPPADKNLTEILNETRKEGKAVYALSFHVDYWNYIGWKDPYSDKAYSERQRNYGQSIGSQRVYTPQMVVNGEVEFVGSNKIKAAQAIDQALKQNPKYDLKVSSKSISDNVLSINYTTDGDPDGEHLNIAVVEHNLTNYVSKGENHGRTLSHDNVVKAFETISFKKGGNFKIDLSQIDDKNATVILYVQNDKHKVLGVCELKLNDVL